MKVGDKVYFCSVVPNCNIYEGLELIIRTVTDDWAVGVDTHTKQAFLFGYNMIGEWVFIHHYEAQEAILKIRAQSEVMDDAL